MSKQTDLPRIATYAESLDRAINAWNTLHRAGTVVSAALTPTDGPATHLVMTDAMVELLRSDLARLYHEAGAALVGLGVQPKDPPATMVAWSANLPGNR